MCFDSDSDTQASNCAGPVGALVSVAEQADGALSPAAAAEVTTSTVAQDEEQDESVAEGLDKAIDVLRQELLEAKEALLMAREEVASAVLVAREDAVKRTAAEARVKTLEVLYREACISGRAGGAGRAGRRSCSCDSSSICKWCLRQ